jgi:Coenzyme PQQ synthesis protein D (PqqD)
MTSLDATPKRKEEILAQQAAGTAVLLSLDDGQYYALDDVGYKVWSLCDGAHTVSDIASIISREYDAALETIEADVIELLEDLAAQKLLS